LARIGTVVSSPCSRSAARTCRSITFGGKDPPAALFCASRDRTRAHPERHLAGYTGILQADVFESYNRLYLRERKATPILEVLCWSNARRKFLELSDIAINALRGRAAPPISPIALEVVKRVDAIIRPRTRDQRPRSRQALGGAPEEERSFVAAFESWMRAERAQTLAPDYMLTRWPLPRRRPHPP
jgi:transposase